MPVARVSGQGGGVLDTGATTVSRAFPNNVSAGSLVIVCLSSYNADAFDLATGPYKLSGTATLGAWQAHSTRRAVVGGGIALGLGIWSAPVTAGGSLTLAYDDTLGGKYLTFATDELTGADTSSTRGYTGVGDNTAYLDTTGSTAVVAGSIAATEGGVFLGAMAYDGSAGDVTITEDAAFSLIYEYELWAVMTGSHILRIVTGATTDTVEWTLGASRPWAGVGAFIKADGAAPSLLPPLLDAAASAPISPEVGRSAAILSSPTAVNITGTSFTPRVDITYA